ncbi:glycine oxidase [Nitzschia inconspicua]|uniref:Glycine oxidase n=1 Tax=Nitzschia inconspicua TaxID=303405 RepID=A0A9K3LKE2_9STRA|nr:glycine oxidase [Nitzschia inconspicua]
MMSSSSSSSSSEYSSKLSTSNPSTTSPRQSQEDISTSILFKQQRRPRQLNKDVVIVGGGLSGLSTALYLSQMDPDRHITILERNDISDAGNMASLAAAGMLAPHSERLPKGDYLDLCMASRRMFSDFVAMVESLAQEAGPEGAEYLKDPQHQTTQEDRRKTTDGSPGNTSMEPWNVGYLASGGFLAPAFAGDNVATWAPPESDDKSSSATWLDATQVRELEPHLHPDVIGGWWFPEDASVDAQRLTRSLKAACVGLGVEFLCGPHYDVTSLDLQDGNCAGLWLKGGKYVSVKSLLVANGAWMRNLLPVPLEPHKGQSLSLQMPTDRPPILRRVLFAQDSYIVPKADGRIVIGATVEAGSFDANVTPAGIMHILTYATQLVPGLADLPLGETWAGLRPTTPDKGPILGETPWKNLYLAGGNWRNGVLLAPKTGQLLASLIASNGRENETLDYSCLLSEKDQEFLKVFAWDRFTSPEGAKRLAANSRYAASMYPVHTRRSGVGVAAAVGTELGSYSTARSAREERRKDREMLFRSSSLSGADLSDLEEGSSSDMDEAFERAAQLGRQDAAAFSGIEDQRKTSREPFSLEAESSTSHNTVPYDGSADAFTVGTAKVEKSESNPLSDAIPRNDTNDSGLQSIYQSIAKNKSKQKVDLPEKAKDERPDPGFRIYHLDKATGRQTEVPPYTNPGQFLQTLGGKQPVDPPKEATGLPLVPESSSSFDPIAQNNSRYDETTYDGYQAILEANGSSDRKDELLAMREARRKNRLGNADVTY